MSQCLGMRGCLERLERDCQPRAVHKKQLHWNEEKLKNSCAAWRAQILLPTLVRYQNSKGAVKQCLLWSNMLSICILARTKTQHTQNKLVWTWTIMHQCVPTQTSEWGSFSLCLMVQRSLNSSSHQNILVLCCMTNAHPPHISPSVWRSDGNQWSNRVWQSNWTRSYFQTRWRFRELGHM